MRNTSDILVSVVMSAYNHESFVGEAIESVLNQNHKKIEFFITDDGSKDGTLSVIKSLKDKRIHFIESNGNRGACTAYNALIEKASGEFICIMNSDDVWNDYDKISKQLECHCNGKKYGAVFSKPKYIDKSGNKIEKDNLPLGKIFDKENRERCNWLEELFMRGNCLCHPSVMIRKECYDSVGLFNNIYRQLPDYDMWIRVLKKYEIYIMDEELISFRILPGENASSTTPENVIRFYNENYLIRKNFFSGVNVIELNAGFSKYLTNHDIRDEAMLEIEKTLLFINKFSNYGNIDELIGLEKISAMIGKNEFNKILEEEYNINANWLHCYSARVSLFLNENYKNIGKYLKTINEQENYIKDLELACRERLEVIEKLDKTRIDLENKIINLNP